MARYNRTIYLNSRGDRWITVDKNGDRDMFFVLRTAGGEKIRRADYYEAVGNFGAIAFRFRGKRFRGIPTDRAYTNIGPLPVVDISRAAWVGKR